MGSNILSLLEVLQCDDEDIIVDTLRTLQKVASGVWTCVWALYWIIERDSLTLTLLPSPIFPSSSPLQQYSGLSFLAALTKKLRIVFSEIQTNLPPDPSHLPNYIHLTNDDPSIVTSSLSFCSKASFVTTLLVRVTQPIEVDTEIILELILFVKEALTTILTNISTIDTLIASLPSDSSPTTPFLSGVDTHLDDSLKVLRKACEEFLSHAWGFFVNMTFTLTRSCLSSIKTIVLDDPSFTDLIVHSLKLNDKEIRRPLLMFLASIVTVFPSMKKQFMTTNLVGRMFETVDFASLPLSESNTHHELTRFLAWMMEPIGDTEEAHFEQYPLIRLSVFEPVKHFITFLFNISDKLILSDEDKDELEDRICWIHCRITHMELRSDEYDTNFVSELAKWEIHTMIEKENEEDLKIILWSMLDRTWEWNRAKPERQKRREVVLREEGWDDAFELRVVGIDVDTDQKVQVVSKCTSSVRTLLASLSLIPSSLLISPRRVETDNVVFGVGGVSMSDHGEMRRNDRRVILDVPSDQQYLALMDNRNGTVEMEIKEGMFEKLGRAQ
ncbi:hypothetical protein BLNAU_3907 [Blattamonas nauphoetae]|uniref:Uncharacterized protein n=1 Tax=Blattamonas nauphoetae TaxID=2049346 RepID=A0ABQ9YBN3_9EUKA|nr:hypothetical protein BLNAU_3907 [Blattamonas nauphoetae]